MRRCTDVLAGIQLGFMAILYGVLVAAVFVQVIARYALHIPAVWSADAALASFIWLAFLSASHAIRERSHFVLDVFAGRLPRASVSVLDAIARILMFVASTVQVVYGYRFTRMSIPTMSPALGISQAWIYAALPVSGILMLIYLVEDTCKSLLERGRGGSPR